MNSLNLQWDFNKDKSEIEIRQNGQLVFGPISMYEIIDCCDPEFMMNHIETIEKEVLKNNHRIGSWGKYYQKQMLKKLES